MKNWKRGRKPLSPDKKQESLNWQKERVKIANLVARKPEIEKVCCICGKPGNILHNRQDPYYITFISICHNVNFTCYSYNAACSLCKILF